MENWSIPLVVATAAFLALVIWRVRPALPWGGKAAGRRADLSRARLRIEGASDDCARAIALCDAADIVAKTVAGAASAKAFYQRAIRTDPQSVEVVRRAAAGLATKPRALESLMWRHLAASPWTGPSRNASRAALDTLRALYEGPLRNSIRARALANASSLLNESAQILQ